MNLSEQLDKIRIYLRDPNSRIWNDEILIRLYNQVQEQIQKAIGLIEEVDAIKVPPMYHYSYMHDWEWPYLGTSYSRFYRCFEQHQQSQHIYAHVWEIQHVAAISSDVDDLGSHCTHPFEHFFCTPADTLKIRYPIGFNSASFIAYDFDPIEHTTKRQLMTLDSSFETTSGTPFSYYRPDELDDSFVLYPRPTTANWTDGQGTAHYANGDVLNDEDGSVSRRTGTYISSQDGLTVDIIDLDDNVFLVYEKNLTDLETNLDGANAYQESDLPSFMRKYIEYGVLARAYRSNGDGRIESLADYWQQRYDLGIQALKKYKFLRKTDRNYCLATQDNQTYRTRRQLRLPSTYPSCP